MNRRTARQVLTAAASLLASLLLHLAVFILLAGPVESSRRYEFSIAQARTSMQAAVMRAPAPAPPEPTPAPLPQPSVAAPPRSPAAADSPEKIFSAEPDEQPGAQPAQAQPPEPEETVEQRPAREAPPDPAPETPPEPVPPSEPPPRPSYEPPPSKPGTTPSAPADARRGVLEDSGPAVLDNPPPLYPPRAARAGHEGTVALRIQVSDTGAVVGAEIAQSSGHRSLDREAIRAVHNKWRFKPAMKGGRPLPGSLLVHIHFTLDPER